MWQLFAVATASRVVSTGERRMSSIAVLDRAGIGPAQKMEHAGAPEIVIRAVGPVDDEDPEGVDPPPMLVEADCDDDPRLLGSRAGPLPT